MSNNQKEKLLSNDVIQNFLEKDHNLLFDKNDKFIELSSSLAYYLKSFSNIKRFLDYIALILKKEYLCHLQFFLCLFLEYLIFQINKNLVYPLLIY